MTAKKAAEAPAETPEQPVEVPEIPELKSVRDLHLYEKLGIVQRHMMAIEWKKSLAAEDINRKPGEKSKSFRTVPVDDMRQGLAQACAKARLIHMLEVTSMEVSLQKEYLWYHRGAGTVTYIDIDHPDERIVYHTTGESQDAGDKGRSKFETNLLKNHIKSAWDVGEGNVDDVDYMTTDKMLEQVEKMDDAFARMEAKKRNREAAARDPFFGGDLAPLRREIGTLMGQSGDAAKVVERYKSEHGQLPQWSREVLEQCVADCKAAKEGGA
jgi:hypothetical protein